MINFFKLFVNKKDENLKKGSSVALATNNNNEDEESNKEHLNNVKEMNFFSHNENNKFNSGDGMLTQLPIELILIIFGYLTFEEQKQASAVCKHWRLIFLNKYKNNIVIRFNNNLLHSSSLVHSSSSFNKPLIRKQQKPSSVHHLLAPTPSAIDIHLYKNLVDIEFLNDSADPTLFLNYMRQMEEDSWPLLNNLKRLKLQNVTMSSQTLFDLIQEAPQLTQLQLIQCDSLFMTGFLSFNPTQHQTFKLNNLKELSLSRNKYLTDFLFNVLVVDSCSTLDTLDLSYCSLRQSQFKSIENQSSSSSISKVMFTVEHLTNILNKMYSHLTSLNLSGIDLFNSNESLLLNVCAELNSLQELYLSQLVSLKVSTLQKLLNNNEKTLLVLDLNESMQDTDGLQLISLSKLKKLYFKKSFTFFTSELPTLASTLTHLDLSCIQMHYRHTVSPDLALALSSLTQLRCFLLAYNDQFVNDDVLAALAQNLEYLEHLDLRQCSLITNAGAHSLRYSKFRLKMKHLDLSGCNNLTNFALAERSEDRGTLKKEIHYFTNLCFRCQKRVNKEPFLFLKMLNTKNSNESVCINNCVQKLINQKYYPDPEDEENINSFVASVHLSSLLAFEHLRVLRLESCVQLTDKCFGYFADTLRHLEELDIKLCTNITGSFVALISEEEEEEGFFIFKNLKILNLNQCIQFSEANLLRLIQLSPRLKQLGVSALNAMSNRVCDYLLTHRRVLHYFDVSFCAHLNESVLDKYELYVSSELGSADFYLDKRFINK